jgi:hypothetical protein
MVKGTNITVDPENINESLIQVYEILFWEFDWISMKKNHKLP